MSPIKDLNVVYKVINEDGTCSGGDIIVGAVIFRLTKDVKIKSVSVKATGDANAHWSEGNASFDSYRRYFKVKQCLIPENGKGTLLSQGVHTYMFVFKIPEGDIPSSFKGEYGKIVYMFEAKISRSWRCPSRAQKEINFVFKSSLHTGEVMCPQSGSVSKKMGGLSNGKVQMSANVNRKVCSPGDTLSVVAKICNSSSKDTRPKFKLQQRTVYRCKNETKKVHKTLVKIVGETIHPNSEQTTLCQLKIPDDAIPTLHNCDIISVEYYIKVYLDISFAFDPEVVFPLVIVPSRFAIIPAGEAVGPYPPGAAGATSCSNFSSPAFPTGPDPVPTGSGACQHLTQDPTQNNIL